MNNSNNIYISLLVCLMTFISCTEIVDVDLPNAGPRLVLEASIDWDKGTKGNLQGIRISTSTPYFNSSKDKSVIDTAIVSVTKENTGEVIPFFNMKNGLYGTKEFICEVGATYTLNIEYNNKVYTATEIMAAVPDIKNVEQKKEPFFTGETVKVSLVFDDIPKETNYYFAYLRYKDTPNLLLRRNGADGKPVRLSYRNEKLLENDTLRYRFYGVSKYYYNYMRILKSQLGSANGSPFSVAPAKIYGNCKNKDNPDEEVLGYFRLSQFVTKTYVVKDLSIDTTDKKNK